MKGANTHLLYERACFDLLALWSLVLEHPLHNTEDSDLSGCWVVAHKNRLLDDHMHEVNTAYVLSLCPFLALALRLRKLASDVFPAQQLVFI